MTHIPVNGNKKLMNTTYGHQLKSNSSQALTSFRPKDFARNLQASTPTIFAQQNYKSDGQQINSPAPAISLLKQKMTNSQNQIAKRMKCNRSANSNFYRTQIRLLLCLVSFSFSWDLIDVTLASEDSRNLSCRQFLTANGCQQCC